MRGFLSLVLVSIALLQMTAAAPTVSGGSEAVKKREGEQNVEKRNGLISLDLPDDDDEEGSPETETRDVEKRNGNFALYLADDAEVLEKRNGNFALYLADDAEVLDTSEV